MSNSEMGIYSITNSLNGKRYIGSAVNISRRFSQHKSDLKKGIHKNSKLQNSWNKNLEESFMFEILLLVGNSDDLIISEQKYIDLYDSANTGYNISKIAGRERFGAKHTDESIQKMKDSHKGYVTSDETKAKLSAAFKGRVFSEETKKKISEAKTGKKRKPFTDQAKLNMSKGMKGRIHSPETRRKLSESHKARLVSL